jgi:hypothetical protein
VKQGDIGHSAKAGHWHHFFWKLFERIPNEAKATAKSIVPTVISSNLS